MIGPLELAIIAVILLIIFGARYLPQLGRSAGKGVRIGTEKGKELAAVAQEKAKDVDTKAIARQAGDHVREARELRDVVKGTTTTETAEPTPVQKAVPPTEPAPAPAAAAAAAAAGEAAPDQPEAPVERDHEHGSQDDAGDSGRDSGDGAGTGPGDSDPSPSSDSGGGSDSGGSSDSGGGDSGGGGGGD